MPSINCGIDVKTGCDIVYIPKFKESALSSELVLENIFTPSELSGDVSMESLAGMFAAKEAVLKALSLELGRWKDIEIKKDESGRPLVCLDFEDRKIFCKDVSISHHEDYAVASCVFVLNP